jgi:cell wall assembly regulator SMI1
MTPLVVQAMGLHRLKAEAIAADVAAAGGWPLRWVRRGLLRREQLELAAGDAGVDVLDEAARPRVGETLEHLTRSLFDVTIEVAGGGREVALPHGQIAGHVVAEGLVPGTTYVLRWRQPDRRPEPDVAGDAAVDAAWERIERWFTEHHPLGAAVLAPGASEASLRALEETIGRPLPSPLRRSLTRHDGQGQGITTVTEGHELLAAEYIADEWTLSREISEKNEPDDEPDDKWWRPSWIEFTSDGSGNGLCLDADTGEVLVRDKVEGGSVETRRFEGWLTRWAEELEAGEQVIDSRGDIELAWNAER